MRYISVVSGRREKSVPRNGRSIALATADDYQTDKWPEVKGSTSSLRFVARTTFTSDPVALPPAGVPALFDFFRSPQHRNHLLLGEGARKFNSREPGPEVVPIRDPTPKLWKGWSQEAALVGSRAPIPHSDEILQLKSSALRMFGMTVFVESIVGAKLLLPLGTSTGNSFPVYQFTLVKDDVRVEGPRTLVWLHKQLMGAGSAKEEQTTHSFSTLRVEPAIEIPGHVLFIYDCTIEINFYFPLMLLRLLPMSREKCNEMGSAAIKQSFEEKGAPCLKNFVRAYLSWLEGPSHV